jgi:4-amino-4-deoxy-L-arabinose transferase-like glycosyltransferase
VFGGETGVLRLLNETLGGQVGWLLGVALAGGPAVLALSRLRRADPRTGWLLAVGGSAATTAVAVSGAEGIFHPYYVAQLAPLTAALAGAAAGVGAAVLLGSDILRRRARVAVVGAVLAALLIAPASWSVQTLDHATSGTFPAGGPATTG